MSYDVEEIKEVVETNGQIRKFITGFSTSKYTT